MSFEQMKNPENIEQLGAIKGSEHTITAEGHEGDAAAYSIEALRAAYEAKKSALIGDIRDMRTYLDATEDLPVLQAAFDQLLGSHTGGTVIAETASDLAAAKQIIAFFEEKYPAHEMTESVQKKILDLEAAVDELRVIEAAEPSLN